MSFITHFNEFSSRILLIGGNVVPIVRILVKVFSREKKIEKYAKSEKVIEIMCYFYFNIHFSQNSLSREPGFLS
ncbi:MAG: hypothetical protein D8M57_02115 [Candidatus Scalindua sp. AMX11]|nr:MAG: hypothetical protein DWQ00_13475 [Candidatus Scalindua sp.]TDE66529.1 MAG: hypothetical protein D8M57_02115 [Candidatus Scalindua sp. AMX11]